jgi:hypothetical protein
MGGAAGVGMGHTATSAEALSHAAGCFIALSEPLPVAGLFASATALCLSHFCFAVSLHFGGGFLEEPSPLPQVLARFRIPCVMADESK